MFCGNKLYFIPDVFNDIRELHLGAYLEKVDKYNF